MHSTDIERWISMSDSTIDILDRSRQTIREWEQSVREQVRRAEQAEKAEFERDAKKLLEWYKLAQQ